MAEKGVLIVGLDPERVDFSVGQYGAASIKGGSMVKAALDDNRRLLERNGYHVDLCMVVPDATAASELKRWLEQRRYDCIVFGAGLRLNPANTDIFTGLIAIARRLANGAAFCFNAGADDTADCVLRAAELDRLSDV